MVGTQGSTGRIFPASQRSAACAAIMGIRKGQRGRGSAVRSSAEILCRQENSKALKLRTDFLWSNWISDSTRCTSLGSWQLQKHQMLTQSQLLDSDAVHFLLKYFIKATFLKTLLSCEFGGKTSLLAPEEHTLCISAAQCYHSYQKATHGNLLFTTFAETLQGKYAEYWLLGKLAAFLPQDVALWRFQHTWAFMCCSTLEAILSWEPLAPRSCIYRTDRASVRAVLAPSHAVICQPSHLGTGSFILLLQSPGGFTEPVAIKSPLLKRLQSRIHPTLQQRWLQPRDINTPERWCAGAHSPDAPCSAKRKWKWWNKHFGTASWLG